MSRFNLNSVVFSLETATSADLFDVLSQFESQDESFQKDFQSARRLAWKGRYEKSLPIFSRMFEYAATVLTESALVPIFDASRAFEAARSAVVVFALTEGIERVAPLVHRVIEIIQPFSPHYASFLSGLLSFHTNSFDASVAEFSMASECTKDPSFVAECLLHLSQSIPLSSSDSASAIQTALQRAACLAPTDLRVSARVHFQLALLHKNHLGDLKQAQECLIKSLSICDELLSATLAKSKVGVSYFTDRGFVNLINFRSKVCRQLRVISLQNGDFIGALEAHETSLAPVMVYELQQKLNKKRGQDSRPSLPYPRMPSAEMCALAQKLNTHFVVVSTIEPDVLKVSQDLAVQEESQTDENGGNSPTSDHFIHFWVVSADPSRRPISHVAIETQTSVRSALRKFHHELQLQNPFCSIFEESDGIDNLCFDPAASQVKAAEILRSLYDLLISPIADLLPCSPDAAVTFIPEGFLLQIPYSCLLAPDGRPLIEKRSLCVSHSFSVVKALLELKEVREAHPIPTNPLVVGDPFVEMSEELCLRLGLDDPRLPSARTEAEEIARRLGTTPILSKEATLPSVSAKLPSATWIHFSCHGLHSQCVWDKPQGLSGIVLGLDETEDGSAGGRDPMLGMLHWQDIECMELSAEMVVLTVCSSGKGEESHAEGSLGLVKGFLMGGAISTIASLWDIPDTITLEIMLEFYAQVAAGASKVRAIREAQMKVIREFDALPEAEKGSQALINPNVWGALVVFGLPC